MTGALGVGVDGTVGRRAGMRREHLDASLAADDLKLIHRTGALQVAGHEQRRMALSLKPFRELAGQCRLAGAL